MPLMDIIQVYMYGILVAAAVALTWSYVLDNNKPPTTREFALKLLARFAFLAFMFAVIIGFLYLAIGLFRTA
jgi:prolipoprotein diacylglyceryltransferase